MLEKIRARLCDEANHWYRMWSSWLAVIWGTLIAALWNDPTLFAAAAKMLPEQYRAPLTPLIFVFSTAMPILIRLLKQKPISNG